MTSPAAFPPSPHRVGAFEVWQLGLVPYSQALELMNTLHQEMVEGCPELMGRILTVEHPPVVTMGNRPRDEDMRATPDELAALGIDFARIDRGGSVTVHEPGQLVLYPLVRVDARHLSVRRLVEALEEAMILTCAHWGVAAQRDAINPGVWVGTDKIGAIGIRVAQHVARHGLALNVNNSLRTFGTIVPCGLHGRGVVSLAQAARRTSPLPMAEVEAICVQALLGILEREFASAHQNAEA